MSSKNISIKEGLLYSFVLAATVASFNYFTSPDMPPQKSNEYSVKSGVLKIDANSSISGFGLGLYDNPGQTMMNFEEEPFNYNYEKNIVWQGKYNDALTLWTEGRDKIYFKTFVDKNQDNIWNEVIIGSTPFAAPLDLTRRLSYPEVDPSFENYNSGLLKSKVVNLDTMKNYYQSNLVNYLDAYIEKIN